MYHVPLAFVTALPRYRSSMVWGRLRKLCRSHPTIHFTTLPATCKEIGCTFSREIFPLLLCARSPAPSPDCVPRRFSPRRHCQCPARPRGGSLLLSISRPAAAVFRSPELASVFLRKNLILPLQTVDSRMSPAYNKQAYCNKSYHSGGRYAAFLSPYADEGVFRHAPHGDGGGKGAGADFGTAQNPGASFGA